MRVEARAIAVLGLVIFIALPAAVLRALCVGRSCDKETQTQRSIPFCSLPDDVRRGIAAGYREDRSPDVLAVARAGVVIGDEKDPLRTGVWPTLDGADQSAIVTFAGAGVAKGVEPQGTFGFDDISPTLAAILNFRLPHPEVRSGKAIEGVANANGARMVMMIVLKNVGARDIESLNRVRLDGVMVSVSGVSLPLAPAPLMATIGTGGTPSQHGVIGESVRNDRGDVVGAWHGPVARSFGSEAGFPGTVIATLSDDLDDVLNQKPKIGLVANDEVDEGLTGGDWYVDVDRDEKVFVKDPKEAIEAAEEMIRSSGFGADPVPDILAVTLDAGNVDGPKLVATLSRTAHSSSDGKEAVVVIGLPSARTSGTVVPTTELTRQVDQKTAPGVVERIVPGGLFLDQDVIADQGITKDQVVAALRDLRVEGSPVFADVFPGIAVSFARFC